MARCLSTDEVGFFRERSAEETGGSSTGEENTTLLAKHRWQMQSKTGTEDLIASFNLLLDATKNKL